MIAIVNSPPSVEWKWSYMNYESAYQAVCVVSHSGSLFFQFSVLCSKEASS